MEGNIENVPRQGKWRNFVKWILIALQLIIWFVVLWYLIYRINHGTNSIFLILIALFLETLIAYLIVLQKTKKTWWKEKLKKILKITLFIVWFILWLIIWFWLLAKLLWYLFYKKLFYISSTFIVFMFLTLVYFFLVSLLVYLIVLRKTKKNWWKEKLKKFLKITLIVLFPILLLSAFYFFINIDTSPKQWNKDKQCKERWWKLSDENDFLCDLWNWTYREFIKRSSRYDYIEIDENWKKTIYYCRGWSARCHSWISDEKAKKAGFFHYYSEWFFSEGFHRATFAVFKGADPYNNLKLNDVITYRVTVMNMGNFALENWKIEDDLVDLSDKTFKLNLWESTWFTYTYTVTQEDVDRWSIFSIVTWSADVVGKNVRIERIATSRVHTISGVNTISRVNTISTGYVDRENIVNIVTWSENEVKWLNSEGDFFIIDVNDSNYPQWCNTPGLPNPEKCILRASNNYCIAPYQTESTQTRYEANNYCNSLDVLWLSRELPYAHPNENNIYWMNLIDVKSKIYWLNANWSEKPWHYRAYPANTTIENCTLNWNCWNESWSYKLSVRCVAPSETLPSEVKNVDNDDLLKNKWLKNEKEQDDKTIKWNICPEWYKYWTYYNTIKWYTNIEYPPNKNRENYEQNFENWEKGLRDKEVKEFTFWPFEWCIPDDWKLEKCTDSGTYDYVFCTINMIPLNNECPQWYSFVRAWVAWPYDLCQWKSDLIIDSKWYIHTYQIPLQDDCEFFAWLGILPGDGHCWAVKGENEENKSWTKNLLQKLFADYDSPSDLVFLGDE